MALLITAIAVLLLVGLALIGREEHKPVMSLEEQAAAELHPTIKPGDTEITVENVRDVIAITLEDGVDHPLIMARKRS